MDSGVYPVALHVPVDVLQLLRQLALSQMSSPVLSCGSALPQEQQHELEQLHKRRCALAQQTADELREIQQQITRVLQPCSSYQLQNHSFGTAFCGSSADDRGSAPDAIQSVSGSVISFSRDTSNKSVSGTQQSLQTIDAAEAAPAVDADLPSTPKSDIQHQSFSVGISGETESDSAQQRQPHCSATEDDSIASAQVATECKRLSFHAAATDGESKAGIVDPLPNMAEGPSDILAVKPSEPASSVDAHTDAVAAPDSECHLRPSAAVQPKGACITATSPEWPGLLPCLSVRDAAETCASDKLGAASSADTLPVRPPCTPPSAASVSSLRRTLHAPQSAAVTAASSAGKAAAAFASKRVQTPGRSAPAVSTPTAGVRQHSQQQQGASQNAAQPRVWNGSTQVMTRPLPAVDGDGFTSVSRHRRQSNSQPAQRKQPAGSPALSGLLARNTSPAKSALSAIVSPSAGLVLRETRTSNEAALKPAVLLAKHSNSGQHTVQASGPETPRHSCDDFVGSGSNTVPSTCSSSTGTEPRRPDVAPAAERGASGDHTSTNAPRQLSQESIEAVPETDDHSNRSTCSGGQTSSATPENCDPWDGTVGAGVKETDLRSSAAAEPSTVDTAAVSASDASTSTVPLSSENRLDRDRRKRKEKLERQRRSRQKKTAKDAAEDALLNQAAEDRSLALAKAEAEQLACKQALQVKKMWQEMDAASSKRTSEQSASDAQANGRSGMPIARHPTPLAARRVPVKPTEATNISCDIVYPNPLLTSSALFALTAAASSSDGCNSLRPDQLTDQVSNCESRVLEAPLSRSASQGSSHEDSLTYNLGRAPLFRLNGERRPCVGSSAFAFNFSVGA